MRLRLLRAGFPLVLALGWLSAAAPARAANYWVGNNGIPPCTHATLQAAIETAVGGAGDDVISLVGTGPFNGPFTVLGGGIEIRGDVTSCGSSSTGFGYSTLRAPSGSRPLTILMGGAETVRLRRVLVTSENGTYSGDGGGIWFAGAGNGSRLELVDSQVFSSTALGEGGGIYVSGGTLSLSNASIVGFNAASNGGGVAARNGARVEVPGGLITNNTALFDGGGIYAADADVVMQSASPNALTVVKSNLAGRDGGGLYLAGDSTNVIDAASRDPAEVSRNRAQRGAGLFVDGATVGLWRATVELNTAAGEGGGAYVTGNGELTSNTLGEPLTLGGYPRIDTNVAADGAALYVTGNAHALLGSGRVRDHHNADTTTILAAAGGAILFLTGVTVQDNGGLALLSLEDAAVVQLRHVSLAGNAVGGIVRWSGSGSTLAVHATALDESEPFFTSFGTPFLPPMFDCVVSRSAAPFANLPPGTVLTDLTIADPEFVSPPNELHLRHTSAAIDRCSFSAFVDLDGDTRAYDDPFHPNAPSRTADAGADEATVLFVDGFESGGLVAWTGGHLP
jgi:predicted outer membrane repeat protein